MEPEKYDNPGGWITLRPAFGSGEDWNADLRLRELARSKLRPAFGSGEDWNLYVRDTQDRADGCARPSGRARIGTALHSRGLLI